MLTTQDLKQIKTVIQDEINPIKKGVGLLQTEVGILRLDVDGLKKDMKVVKKDLSKVKSDLKVTIEFFDNDLTRNKKRIERVENHLGLPVIADF